MMLFDISESVVVFDLDDTLYFEGDCVESGIRYVCKKIESLTSINPLENVKSAEALGRLDWLAVACESAGLPASAKESLLWMYRLHPPDIALSAECSRVLKEVRKQAVAVAILTDGRSITQRLKLQALGLGGWPVYISEDYGSGKPSPERFLAIKKDYPARSYIYIGDNIEKDFLGCNPLGWISIWMQGGERNIHNQKAENVAAEALPMYRVSGWGNLGEILYGAGSC